MKWFDDDLEKDFENMRRRMEKMLGTLSRPGPVTLCGDTDWRPSIDLYETTDEFIVLVDVAGIKPEDVEVIADGEVVRISGNRCRPPDKGITRVHHMEIDFGPFHHSVRLPGPVNLDSATSVYRDGLLAIHLPKQVKAEGPVNIKVHD